MCVVRIRAYRNETMFVGPKESIIVQKWECYTETIDSWNMAGLRRTIAIKSGLYLKISLKLELNL